jgi:hypothetical protein
MSDRTPHLFSKRHYVWLASVMRDIRHKLGNRTAADIATSVLADALADNSPGFDRQRFMDAVQWNPNKATQPPTATTPSPRSSAATAKHAQGSSGPASNDSSAPEQHS